MKKLALLLLLPALVAIATPATADWPHWRGPERTGVSPETDLPLTWSREENVVWKLPLPGLAGATPVVWGERLYVAVADGENLALWGVDAGSGEVAWKRHLGGGNESSRKGNRASPSPVVDADGVWALTGTGVLAGFDHDGKELWKRDLQAEFGKFGILHGYSSSPLLHDGRLYVQVLHGFYTDDPSYVLALDKTSGRTLWRVERPTDAPREAPDAYTTPALLVRAGKAEIVVSGADYVTGHDAATGAELWRVPGLNPSDNPMQRVVASPIVVGDMIYAPSRVRPLLALRASGPSGTPPELVWSTERGPDVPTPAIDGESLYILTDRGVVWRLAAATGEVVWGPERVRPSVYSASPVVADGRVYVTDEEGATSVIAAGGNFEILAENEVGEYTLSSLAIADGRIFLRTADHLFCIGRPATAASGP